MADHLKHFTEANFQQEIAQGVTLVDFYADWCGPCKVIAPIVAELANELQGQAVVGKINVDDAQEIATKYNVSSIPTLIVFKNGTEIKRAVGVKDKNSLREMITSAL